ncbi:MAG TPA: A/G-specific adenine glycosylase [Mariniphaga sp.]|nr:A/G-specific adenine glycosylase [Mariniphaga sp.]
MIQLIYSWYNKNKRNLPWRTTTDPYKIWLSEVILQQTRVEQGISYYYKFINSFPDVFSLANAGEEEVLKLWMGLGYYSRARNLHKSAKIIAEKHEGFFPRTYNEILSLKGVGSYTAAAIASIAFDQHYPVLDGNVYRFLSRYFGISTGIDTTAGKKEFNKIAFDIMPVGNTGFHNQALMEFGALQCVPVSPDCHNCPLCDSCYAFTFKKVKELPVKVKKTKKRERYFYYFLVEDNNHIWLEKRSGNDIWKNLFQYPLHETDKGLDEQDIINLLPSDMTGIKYNLKSVSSVEKHILTHQTIFARLIHIELLSTAHTNHNYLKVKSEELHNYAVPRLIEKLSQKNDFLKFTY